MERFICIHGHFYQPPRENPWLEAIELQDSAYPYHDWNERITSECYATNAVSRILDGDDRIIQITNNYANISFNFGPTLLSWLEERSGPTYEAILDADRQSRDRFSGHGSALAQAYNHMILPLGTRRDKYTQVLWGIKDFERRFGRFPEGMWLPETAVDLETLEVLAELGIVFVILSPYQASRTRRFGARNWRNASEGRIDPSLAYELRLESGRKINLFFYDGPISRAIAFEGLLRRGEDFAHRLANAFSENRSWPQIVNIATDGETYGHHHRHGEMALAYALHYIDTNNLARLTNYGEYLERFPPNHQVEITENTAWSCSHGLGRWMSDCGCNSGREGWNQGWRAPLREAFDWLRDTLAPDYERIARDYFKDPWEARNEYISVILDRSRESVDRFFEKAGVRRLMEDERVTAIKLLEIQRHAMLMYTSCGWFFDDISGIETVQVIQYAGRAVQLAEELFGESIESPFLDRLHRAKSNVADHGDGRYIYEKWVKPSMVDLTKVGAHYAVSSLFKPYGQQSRIYCYAIDREDYRVLPAGKSKLAVGRVRVTSEITGESSRVSFAVLHFGDHNLAGGIRPFRSEQAYEALFSEMSEVFLRMDILETFRLVDKHFGGSTYSLKLLFRDEQRNILNILLESTIADAEETYRQLYEEQVPLMRFLSDLGIPNPRVIQEAAEFAINSQLRKAFDDDDLDLTAIKSLLEVARTESIKLDDATLEYKLRNNIERMAAKLAENPADFPLLARLESAVTFAQWLPFEVDFWTVQNRYWEMTKTVYHEYNERSAAGDAGAAEWVERFKALGDRLAVRME